MSVSDQAFINQFSSSLSCDETGIYYADHFSNVSYPKDGNDLCFDIEDKSFWFRHRNSCIIEMIRNYPPLIKGPIFDIGGGNGYVAKGIKEAGWDVVLVEPGSSGARNAKKRGIAHVVCASSQSAKFKHGTLPAIGVFDVVEHIENDIEFLNHLWELLIPGGMLYITVPAYQSLWSLEDEDAGHFRRYTLKQLEKKLEQSGFSVKFSTYFFTFLPIIIFFFRTLPYRFNLLKKEKNYTRRKNDHSIRQGLHKTIIKFLMNLETILISKRISIYHGGSCLISATKRNK